MSTAKIVAELGGKEPPPYTWIVINVLYYLKPLSRLIVQSEPLENIGSDMQRSAFISLKSILSILQSGANDPININPFLEKLCFVTNTSLVEFESSDIHSIWDSVVKLITAVIPPLREVFLGRISDSADIPCWTSLLSRCFHAQFQASTPTLEDVMRATLAGYEDEDEEEEEYGDEEDADLYDPRPPLQRIEKFNANILYRAPEILVFMVESSHLPPNLRFSEMCAGVEGNSAPPGTISFPSSFDVSALLNETEEEYPPQMYDLSVVVSLEDKPEDDPASPPAEAPLPGADAMTPPAFDSVRALYRSVEEGEQMGHGGWFEGMGSRAHHQEVAADTVLTNFFSPHRVHPRVLIYTKRDMALQRLGKYVTRAGQMRSLGDVSFESAETPEQYDEARHFYLEAIAYDAALRPALTERLNALEQIERNQRAQCYETQADISLGRRRFKEACDLYKNAMRSAVVNSPLHQRIREKEDYMMKIISLEIANHLTEKG
ncbi:hypothetical protein B484DRAFT_16316 [Ochromonadaceae sp. CCMP2298]|nr:hypothetical protein B484DRAFT_16316 [Ochromonadaceae sp. CCMP2298]